MNKLDDIETAVKSLQNIRDINAYIPIYETIYKKIFSKEFLNNHPNESNKIQQIFSKMESKINAIKGINTFELFKRLYDLDRNIIKKILDAIDVDQIIDSLQDTNNLNTNNLESLNFLLKNKKPSLPSSTIKLMKHQAMQKFLDSKDIRYAMENCEVSILNDNIQYLLGYFDYNIDIIKKRNLNYVNILNSLSRSQLLSLAYYLDYTSWKDELKSKLNSCKPISIDELVLYKDDQLKCAFLKNIVEKNISIFDLDKILALPEIDFRFELKYVDNFFNYINVDYTKLLDDNFSSRIDLKIDYNTFKIGNLMDLVGCVIRNNTIKPNDKIRIIDIFINIPVVASNLDIAQLLNQLSTLENFNKYVKKLSPEFDSTIYESISFKDRYIDSYNEITCEDRDIKYLFNNAVNNDKILEKVIFTGSISDDNILKIISYNLTNIVKIKIKQLSYNNLVKLNDNLTRQHLLDFMDSHQELFREQNWLSIINNQNQFQVLHPEIQYKLLQINIKNIHIKNIIPFLKSLNDLEKWRYFIENSKNTTDSMLDNLIYIYKSFDDNNLKNEMIHDLYNKHINNIPITSEIIKKDDEILKLLKKNKFFYYSKKNVLGLDELYDNINNLRKGIQKGYLGINQELLPSDVAKFVNQLQNSECKMYILKHCQDKKIAIDWNEIIDNIIKNEDFETLLPQYLDMAPKEDLPAIIFNFLNEKPYKNHPKNLIFFKYIIDHSINVQQLSPEVKNQIIGMEILSKDIPNTITSDIQAYDYSLFTNVIQYCQEILKNNGEITNEATKLLKNIQDKYSQIDAIHQFTEPEIKQKWFEKFIASIKSFFRVSISDKKITKSRQGLFTASKENEIINNIIKKLNLKN